MKLFFIPLMLLITLGLTGCETMEGVGKDIKTLGDKIEKKAKTTSE